MKKILRPVIVILMLFVFCLAAQVILKPKMMKSSTSMMDDIYSKHTGEIDVLFIGSSQLYCTVNTPKLTEQYGINSYNIGAGKMPLTFEYYYLQEALKYKHPKTVIIEVGPIFKPLSEVGEDAIVYAFTPTRYSKEKKAAVETVVTDKKEQARILYFPLLKYHSRWNDLKAEDLIYPFFPLLRRVCDIPQLEGLKPVRYLNREVFKTGGFLSQSRVQPIEPAYLSDDDGERKDIPPESVEALASIYDLCREKGLELLFFKTPSPEWTRSDSAAVKEFMEQKGYPFADLNDHLEEMKIDSQTDFYDNEHLNCYGADKVTDFIGKNLFTTIIKRAAEE